MKKNIIIGVLSLLLIVMTVISYIQKIHSDEAMKIAVENKEKAEKYQMEAEHARIIAEHQAIEAKMAMDAHAKLTSELQMALDAAQN